MAKLMNNRTDNDIKNKWYSMMRKEQNARQNQAKKQPKTQRAIFDVDMPNAAIDNETIYDGMIYDEFSQLTNGPRASDALFLAAYSRGTQSWGLPNFSGQDHSAFYSPQFAAEGQGSFTMLSHAAASQPMIRCNGTAANVVMESYPMTLQMHRAEPNRCANFGVPNPSVAMQLPRDPIIVDWNVSLDPVANQNMPTATEVGCTPSMIGVKRCAPV
jgi:hypothetical protein